MDSQALAGSVAEGSHSPAVEKIHAELERILASKPFSASARSREFLTFVVTKAAAGQTERLKERTIGIELFGRTPAYDNNEDSVVRVRANDVRRRLAEYYAEHSQPGELRILLPAGTYLPQFLESQVIEDRVSVEPGLPHLHRNRLWILAACLAAAGLVAVAGWSLSGTSAIDAFWKPYLNDRAPVLIGVSGVQAFSVARLTEMQRSPGDPPEVATAVAKSGINPEQSIPVSEIRAVKSQVMTFGLAAAAMSAQSVLGAHRTASAFRLADQFTSEDLREHPSIMIGAYSNAWVLRLSRNLRFHFEREGARHWVRDTANPSAAYELISAVDGEPTLDYVVVTRLLRNELGRPTLLLSGMTQYGCAAAARIATEATVLDRLLAGHAGWRTRNLQILARVNIVRQSAASPEFLAVHVW